jgi:hypothetical protein
MRPVFYCCVIFWKLVSFLIMYKFNSYIDLITLIILVKCTNYEALCYVMSVLLLPLCLWSTYSSQHFVPFIGWETKLHTYIKKSQIIILCILIYMFLERGQEDERFQIEWWQAFSNLICSSFPHECNIYYIYSQLFELWYIFEEFIWLRMCGARAPLPHMPSWHGA